MVSFGGLLSVGGGHLVCAGCAARWFHFIGGLGTVHRVVSPFLADTEFRLTGGSFGGATGSAGAALLDALGLSRHPLDPELPELRLSTGERLPGVEIGLPDKPS